MIDGSRIQPGDVILGLPSNGLHTNGYSLARKIFFERAAAETGLAAIAGFALVVRRRALADAQELPAAAGAMCPTGKLKGLAHITGGGLIDNLPRILPDDCDAVIDTRELESARQFSRSCRSADA